MTTTPTPEQFLAQPADPDDEDLDEQPTSPLESIADSLRRITAVLEASEGAETAALDRSEVLREEVDILGGALDEKQALLNQVLEICKPSTSKLANAIRAAIEPPPAAAVEPDPAPPSTDQPAQDAPVEHWRAYARGRGYAGPDIDKANRSQIRTMLGIPHSDEGSPS